MSHEVRFKKQLFRHQLESKGKPQGDSVGQKSIPTYKSVPLKGIETG
jgi:hypothetical protein